MNSCIAFDLDGTLITCQQKQTMLLKYIMASNKILQKNTTAIWELKRAGYSTFDALIKNGFNNSLAKKMCDEWCSSVEDFYWLSYDTPYNDVYSALELLNSENELYLITARKNKNNVLYQLSQLGLDRFFRDVFVVPQKNVSNNKKKILELLRCDFFIGDTESDFFATEQLSTQFIGCINGQRNKHYLSCVGVNVFIDNISNINLYIK
ncbi:HAD hydrolase-like protein [Escherichia coli]|uniref:HAD family hydrolase n=1 Tax=Escherichia coli TaxID=562 RepID=UPI000FB4F43A|nr:HAD hydrolase-like protein [Escherichia coli]EEW1871408.1 hypothetical protein [Escherichia coli]EFC5372420.1 HAD hydrolase-like protein [Escherichia coli]EFH3755571.1 HAD hydrolase-like protein [Escherichia coli]EFJ1898870.1 HAD hydrolase-like protein [Escherichia coli]EFM0297490.1 HAD hydrolase-like protein [Escherichia coli]